MTKTRNTSTHPRSESVGQLASGVLSNFVGTQLNSIPDRVQLDIAFNIFGKVDCVACLARKHHHVVLVEAARLVFALFHDNNAMGTHVVGCQQNKVLAGNAKERFHCDGVGGRRGMKSVSVAGVKSGVRIMFQSAMQESEFT